MQFNSSSAYLSFEKLIQYVDVWLKREAPPLFNYSQPVVVARLAQRIVELGLFKYVQICANRHNEKLVPVCIEREKFSCAGLVFNEELGVVKPSWVVLLKAIAEFWLHWFHVLGVFCLVLLRVDNALSFFTKPDLLGKSGKATLLFGVGIEAFNRQEGDSKFVEYCRDGDITPLINAHHVIVQSIVKLQSRDSSFSYSRFPLHTLMRRNPMGFCVSLRFLFQHLNIVFLYLLKTIQCPVIALLGRDFAYQSMVDYLNRNGLIEAVILTNSNYSAQPLWMRETFERFFKVHMVWYSQNIIPLIYADDEIVASIPNYRHLIVDEHWLWTKSFVTYLKSLNLKGDFNIVSPIMWYLPTINNSSDKTSNEIKVTVFDVTPVNSMFAQKIGIYKNYYNTANCIDFINTIVTTCELISKETDVVVSLFLKHKRAHASVHDADYISVIEALCDNKRLNLIEHDSNIFNLIAGSQLVIVMPYSSPAIISNKLNIPAIYLDVSNQLVPTFECCDTVKYVSDAETFYEQIKRLVT